MNEIEKQYVYNVYNSISEEFSSTRQYAWPCVKKFINSLPIYSLVCDVGSGNGKNMFRNDLEYFATDISEYMCELSSKKTNNVCQSNILSLPFNDSTFDSVISIACIHHLNTAERRKKAIEECKRILKPNGSMLISVWANSDRYGSGDQYIKWNNHETKRYYHLFDKDELSGLCDFKHEIIYEKHNYYITSF